MHWLCVPPENEALWVPAEDELCHIHDESEAMAQRVEEARRACAGRRRPWGLRVLSRLARGLPPVGSTWPLELAGAQPTGFVRQP